MKKLLIMVLIFAILSGFAAAQIPDIPDIGPGGCVPIHPTTGAPCPECCPQGGEVKPKPPDDDVKPKPPAPDDGAKPDEPEPDDDFKKPYDKAKPDQGGIIDNGKQDNGKTSLDSPECTWTCTAWNPSDCRGGTQERNCNCACPACEGDNTEQKICPTSTGGYPNIQTGSYWYGQPVQFYLAETDGKLWLISGGGQLIEGIGLHVGEPDAKVPINTLLSDITRFRKVIPGKYSAKIKGAEDFADTTVKKTEKGFKLGFNVKPDAKVGKKQIALNVMRDGQVVASIPLVADIQPSIDLRKETPEIPRIPKNYSGGILIATFIGFLIIGLLSGLIVLIFRKRKGTNWSYGEIH